MSPDVAQGPWPSVRTGELLVIPMGSCEQHGPHLPLDTDLVIAEAIAHRVAERLQTSGTSCAVAPGIAFGSSGEHQDFPGTLSIGTEVLCGVVIELVRSAAHWCERVAFINGHGGNNDALRTAIRQVRSETHEAAWINCSVPFGDAHAGDTETSLMLGLAPNRVGDHRQVIGNQTPIGALLPRLRDEGVRAVSSNGVLGDARDASPERGAAIMHALAERICAALLSWHVADDGRLTE